MLLSFRSLAFKRAPSSGRGRLACEPGIGRRRRVVSLAAIAGRLHRYESHPDISRQYELSPLPPLSAKGNDVKLSEICNDSSRDEVSQVA